MKKKTTLRLTALLLLLSLCVTPLSTFAALPEETPVSPFYTGVATVTRAIDVSASGCASCYGRITVRSGYTADMDLYLEQSSDNESWTTVKSWSTSGTGTLTLDKIYFVPSGYYYRTAVEVSVYDSDGNYVEFITGSSGSQYY